MERHRRDAVKALLAALVLCLVSVGCASRPATRTEAILTQISDLTAAEQIFGPATTKSSLGGGGVRAVWSFSRVFNAPARTVDRDVFVGYDSDGYPVYRTVTMYVPPHGEFQNCRIDVTAGPDGRIIQSSAQGNSCDLLLTPQGREAVMGSSLPAAE